MRNDSNCFPEFKPQEANFSLTRLLLACLQSCFYERLTILREADGRSFTAFLDTYWKSLGLYSVQSREQSEGEGGGGGGETPSISRLKGRGLPHPQPVAQISKWTRTGL